MKFKENAIKRGMVIHCPKEEDARVLLEHLKELGYKWVDGKRLTTTTCWHDVLGEGVYYCLGGDKYVTWKNRKSNDKITEFSDLIESEPRFKVGDKVRVRNDLKVGEVYGELTLWEGDMSSCEGTAHTIGEIDGDKIRFQDDGTYKWSAEMLEPVDDSPAEMSAVEVLEWLQNNLDDSMDNDIYKVFGNSKLDSMMMNFTAKQIVEGITAYETTKKAPKPVELEWVNYCEIYQDFGDGTFEFCAEYELPDGEKKAPTEEILRKYMAENEGDYYAVPERRCRAKGE